jgi:hypothetical protein
MTRREAAMEEMSSGGIARVSLDVDGDDAAYHDGYTRVMRELQWVRSRGWMPTERQITVALMQTARVYAAARRGRSVGGQHPEWLRGRVDALRTLLREGVGLFPEDE